MLFISRSIIRSLIKNKLNSLIKILGISISVMVLIFVIVFVKHEISYDKHIPESESIHRVIRDWQGSGIYSPSTPVPLLQELIACFPEIKTGSRLHYLHDNVIKVGERVYYEDEIYAVDSSFLQTFNLQLTNGNSIMALDNPGSALISKSKSQSYFGDGNPIGKVIEFEGSEFNVRNKVFTITGVFDDYPVNTHFQPDFLLTLKSFRIYNQPNHNNHSIATYVKLRNGANSGKVEKKLPEFMKEFYGNDYYEYARSTYLLEPITKIHLNTSVYNYGYETEKGDAKTIVLYPVLALLILVIAGINYLNLIIAEGQKKGKDFGINKINGADKSYFFKYFVIESAILIGIALILAIVASGLLLPVFSRVMGRQLNLDGFMNGGGILTFLPVLVLLVIGGMVPAFVFSRKKALNFISGKGKSRIPSSHQVSQVFQFTICIFFLIGSFVIYKQLNFIDEETNSSMNTDNVLVIYNARYLDNHRDIFKQRLIQISGVKSVSLCSEIPGNGDFSTWGLPLDSALKSVHVAVLECDQDYARVLGIQMVNGRFFDSDFGDDINSIVLNETVIKELGWQENPIGKRYRVGKNFTVIGVSKDIHFESLQYDIYPQAFIPNRHKTSATKVIAKLSDKNVDGTIRSIQSVWKELVPARELNFGFLDREYEQWYKTEHKTLSLTIILAAIAMFLSGLGLFAAILDKIQNKIKEIGIRKVNGAKVSEILAMLNKDFVRWVAIAFVIATPVAYYAMNKWLENFAYKTTLSWWIFALAGFLALGIALLTVSWQSWRAATRNPVEALRYE